MIADGGGAVKAKQDDILHPWITVTVYLNAVGQKTILTLMHWPSLETHIIGQYHIFHLKNWSVVPNLGSSHIIKLSFFHFNNLKPEPLANRRLENRKKNSPIIYHDKCQ